MDNALHTSQAPQNLCEVSSLFSCQQFPGFFSATVRGVSLDGAEFEADVPLDGHLDNDLYLRLNHRLRPRSELFIVLRLTRPLEVVLPAVRVALHGKVNRIDLLPGGEYDLCISILSYRTL